MSFEWCECDKYKKGKQLELIKDSYQTFSFETLEDLTLSMKPLTTFDAKNVIKNLEKVEKKIINQIPENIILKSKPFKLSLDQFDDFIFNDELFHEDSIDIETLDDKEIEYIDNIRKYLEKEEQEFILLTERGPVIRGSFYNQSCTIYMMMNNKQSHLYKKLNYKWNSQYNKEFILKI